MLCAYVELARHCGKSSGLEEKAAGGINSHKPQVGPRSCFPKDILLPHLPHSCELGSRKEAAKMACCLDWTATPGGPPSGRIQRFQLGEQWLDSFHSQSWGCGHVSRVRLQSKTSALCFSIFFPSLIFFPFFSFKNKNRTNKQTKTRVSLCTPG